MTIDEHFDRLEALMEARFAAVDAKFAAVDAKFAAVDARFDAVDARFDQLTRYILDFRQETIIRLDSQDRRFEILVNAVSSLDSRMPAMAKGLMDFGMEHKDLFIEHSRLKEGNSSLAARVEKLEAIVSGLVKPAA